MFSVTVLLESFLRSVEEGGDAVAVPFFEGVAVQRECGAAALVGEDADLVDEVGVEWPAGGDHAGVGVPDVFVVEPGDDVGVPVPDGGAEVGVGAGGDVPGAG